MSIDNLQELGGPSLFNARSWIEEFEEALESANNVSVLRWASEVPDELRDRVVPHLLKRYFDFYRTRGWTVQLADFVERFPEFEQLVDRLNTGPPSSSALDDTVSTSLLTTTTRYDVDDPKWKEGGQGVLHKAVEGDIGGRKVAIKFLKDAERQDEFRKEIEVTARLEHPGVAAVFSHGVEDKPQGRPFYAMRLIHGKSLEDRIASLHNRMTTDGTPAPERFDPADEDGIATVLECIISACHTVSHAHRAGVLHCDPKPKNIICGDFQATIVLDWGSAQSYDVPRGTASDSTPPIELPGETSRSHTIGYASPEQLTQHELTPASDVFCLGATLYHALTGQAPFGNDRQLQSICKLPRELNRRIPKRLEAVCQKAMQPAPEDRYQSVEDLARDLKNWLRDDEVSAAPDSFLERAFRVARHHKHATAIGIFAAFALIVLGSVAWNKSIRQRQASESLGSAFNLIEDLCRPLEDDAVANSSEFEGRAEQVARFASSYINENPKDAKLGRAYELLGLVSFYRHNRPVNPSRQEDLDLAIADLREAEEIHRAATDSNVPLAQNLVRQARWLRKRAVMELKGYEKKKMAFTKLTEAVELIESYRQERGRGVTPDRVLAEAYQILGEFMLRNQGALVMSAANTIEELEEGQDEDVIQGNLLTSERYFSDAINQLTRYDAAENCRNLARGYGFRGDARMALRMYERAYEDYDASLELRRNAYEKDPTDENQFQLARGYGNLGHLVLYTPDHEALDELDDIPGEGTREVKVFESYVVPSLRLMEQLATKSFGDERPRTDYRRISNIAAQLHFFAAMHPGQTAEQKASYLSKAQEFADQAINAFDVPDNCGQNVKNELASSYAIMIQIAMAGETRGSAADRIQDLAHNVNKLIDADKKGYENLNAWQLRSHAIALAATKQNMPRLRGVVEQMSNQGLEKDSCCQKHIRCFGDPEVKAMFSSLFEE